MFVVLRTASFISTPGKLIMKHICLTTAGTEPASFEMLANGNGVRVSRTSHTRQYLNLRFVHLPYLSINTTFRFERLRPVKQLVKVER